MKKILMMVMVLFAFMSSAFAAGKVRIGYWTSGVSLGFGSVLEESEILQKKYGVDAEYVRLPDLLAQITALSSGDIDIAYAAPISAVFNAIHEGAPIKVVAGTQLADAVLVAPANSAVHSWSDLRGKRVGASKPNAAVTVIAGVIADKVYGVKKDEYSIVQGNEGRLVQYLSQNDVDAAVIRTITYDQYKDKLGLRLIGSLPQQWKAVAKNNIPPYIGSGIVNTTFLKNHPDIVARVVRSWIDLEKWGKTHKDEIIDIVQRRAGLSPENARDFASRWDYVYRTSLSNQVLSTLRTEHNQFAGIGQVKGSFSASIFDQGPYLKAGGKK